MQNTQFLRTEENEEMRRFFRTGFRILFFFLNILQVSI